MKRSILIATFTAAAFCIAPTAKQDIKNSQRQAFASARESGYSRRDSIVRAVPMAGTARTQNQLQPSQKLRTASGQCV